jgi:hypothetical protein
VPVWRPETAVSRAHLRYQHVRPHFHHSSEILAKMKSHENESAASGRKVATRCSSVMYERINALVGRDIEYFEAPVVQGLDSMPGLCRAHIPEPVMKLQQQLIDLDI